MLLKLGQYIVILLVDKKQAELENKNFSQEEFSNIVDDLKNSPF